MLEQIRETRLENGLVILTDHMPSVRSVTLGFFFRVGARHEPRDLHGITHFIEHAVFKGTARRTALDIAIEQDRLGGNLDAFTTHEETGFAIKVIDEQLPRAFDLIADMLLEPTFDQSELEAEQRVIIEEMKMIDDSPEEYLGELFSEALFPDHPLGRTITGTATSVRQFDRTTTRAYHEKAFTARELVIACAGNMEHDDVVSMIQATSFGRGTADGHEVEREPTPPSPAAPFLVKQRSDLEQAHLIISTPMVGATDERRYAADLLTNIIGGGTSSRLWQKVREERGLAYSVGASAAMYQDCGVFSVFAATSPEQVSDVVALAVAEMRDVVATGITADEIELAKEQARAGILLSLEDSASRAAAMAQSEMVHGRQISVEETLEKIAAVTVGECNRLAGEFFRSAQIGFGAIGDLDDIDRELLVI